MSATAKSPLPQQLQAAFIRGAPSYLVGHACPGELVTEQEQLVPIVIDEQQPWPSRDECRALAGRTQDAIRDRYHLCLPGSSPTSVRWSTRTSMTRTS